MMYMRKGTKFALLFLFLAGVVIEKWFWEHALSLCVRTTGWKSSFVSTTLFCLLFPFNRNSSRKFESIFWRIHQARIHQRADSKFHFFFVAVETTNSNTVFEKSRGWPPKLAQRFFVSSIATANLFLWLQHCFKIWDTRSAWPRAWGWRKRPNSSCRFFPPPEEFLKKTNVTRK